MDQLLQNKNGSGVFIQVGAGAGDRDTRANNRDGFTEFVKSLSRDRIKKIVLVEPNPINIPKLKECWEDYNEAEIVEYAIVPTKLSGSTLDFYYSTADGPHYQVASINKNHVEKHYGNRSIQKFSVPTIDLETLLKPYQDTDIELLALDIEGIDGDVILDTNFQNLGVHFLSYEHIHLGNKKNEIASHLNNQGMLFIGKGIDHNGFDLLCKKM